MRRLSDQTVFWRSADYALKSLFFSCQSHLIVHQMRGAGCGEKASAASAVDATEAVLTGYYLQQKNYQKAKEEEQSCRNVARM